MSGIKWFKLVMSYQSFRRGLNEYAWNAKEYARECSSVSGTCDVYKVITISNLYLLSVHVPLFICPAQLQINNAQKSKCARS